MKKSLTQLGEEYDAALREHVAARIALAVVKRHGVNAVTAYVRLAAASEKLEAANNAHIDALVEQFDESPQTV